MLPRDDSEFPLRTVNLLIERSQKLREEAQVLEAQAKLIAKAVEATKARLSLLKGTKK